VTTPEPVPAPEATDLRGLARGLRELVDLAARMLRDEAGPSELGQRVIDHLGCELSEVVPVTERFPIWEHVNVQRGVDAYLAAHGSDGAWIGLSGATRRPPVLRGSHFTEVLAEMNGEHHTLTRSLLGVGAGSDDGPGEPGGPTPGLLARHPRPRPTHRRFPGDVT
jgi:hypothetical protein